MRPDPKVPEKALNPLASSPEAGVAQAARPPKPASLDKPLSDIDMTGGAADAVKLEGPPPPDAQPIPPSMPDPRLGGMIDPDQEDAEEHVFGPPKPARVPGVVHGVEDEEEFDPQTDPDHPDFDPSKPKKVIYSRKIAPGSRMTY